MTDFDFNEEAILTDLGNAWNKLEFLPNLHSGDMQEIIRHINGLRYIVYAHNSRRLGRVQTHNEPFYEIEVTVEPKWGN
jgi:hypothetical protein